jgi:hypothetical protein
MTGSITYSKHLLANPFPAFSRNLCDTISEWQRSKVVVQNVRWILQPENKGFMQTSVAVVRRWYLSKWLCPCEGGLSFYMRFNRFKNRSWSENGQCASTRIARRKWSAPHNLTEVEIFEIFRIKIGGQVDSVIQCARFKIFDSNRGLGIKQQILLHLNNLCDRESVGSSSQAVYSPIARGMWRHRFDNFWICDSALVKSYNCSILWEDQRHKARKSSIIRDEIEAFFIVGWDFWRCPVEDQRHTFFISAFLVRLRASRKR